MSAREVTLQLRKQFLSSDDITGTIFYCNAISVIAQDMTSLVMPHVHALNESTALETDGPNDHINISRVGHKASIAKTYIVSSKTSSCSDDWLCCITQCREYVNIVVRRNDMDPFMYFAWKASFIDPTGAPAVIRLLFHHNTLSGPWKEPIPQSLDILFTCFLNMM
jgi:hypothetical protein